jgi:signal transduction histidine kinase/DNA-binding response OmpR family regulator
MDTAGASLGDTPLRYVQTQWTTKDGLPVNSVNDIAQTEDGYLWLATYDGLVRFDGKKVTVFRSAQHEGLPNNRLLSLRARADGLWVQTESRHLVRVQDGRFTTVAEGVNVLREGQDGRLWLGTQTGVFTYREGALRRVSPESLSASVRALLVAADGTLWVGTRDEGVYFRRPNGRVQHLTIDDGLAGWHVWAFAEDRSTQIWIGMPGGLQRWSGGRLVDVPRERGGPLSVFDVEPTAQMGEKDAGSCVAVARDGLFRCEEGRLVPVARQSVTGPARARSLIDRGPNGKVWAVTSTTVYRGRTPVFNTGSIVKSLFFGRRGTVWVGTARHGLFRLRPSRFAVYGAPEGLASSNVYPIEQREDGSIWLGMLGGGLARLEGSGAITNYRPVKNGRPLTNVWALHEDRSGRLLMSGAAGRLCQFEAGGCARPASRSPIRARVRALYEDRRGRLWAASEDKGLYRCDRACMAPDSDWARLTPTNSGLPHSDVRTIHETPAGTIWVGTRGGGIARYADGAFETVTASDGLSSNYISDIYQDSTRADASGPPAPDVLWVATSNAGLNRVELSPSDTALVASIATYREEEGLHDNALGQILRDGQGRLWMSSNRGLFWVWKHELEALARGEARQVHAVTYTTRDGLRSREANGGVQPAGIVAQDGRLWFPTQGGAVSVDPADITTNPAPPPIHIEGVTSDDRVVSADTTGTVTLGATQRTFEVAYNNLRLDDPTDVTYRYRLVGLQHEWVHTQERRRAYFTEVPPGRYTFEVAARTHLGPWSPTPDRLTVNVAPHWWETAWFYGLCALGLLGLGGGAYWWRTWRLRQHQKLLKRTVDQRTDKIRKQRERLEEQATQLKELDDAKSRFFANISHELRTPLTLIQGPVQRLGERADQRFSEETAQQVDFIERNASRLRRLVDRLLGLADLQTKRHALAARPVDLAQEARRVVQSFGPKADRQELTLEIEADSALGDRPADMPAVHVDPEAFEQILSNLLSNALKFTPAEGYVSVAVRGHADAVEIIVRDTGIGISKADQDVIFDRFVQARQLSEPGPHGEEGVGIGLALVQDLVDLHGGTISVESVVGEGTTFTTRFPRGTAHLSEDQMVEDTSEAPPRSATPSTEAQAPEDPAPARADAPDATTGDKRVLVVDDNADVRRFVRSILTPTFEVIEAADGAVGLQAARRHLPDVILADVMMPSVDGCELTRRLRDTPETKAIPIIMVTARAASQDEVAGLREGADDYVTKPFDAAVLRQRVEGVLAFQQRLRRRVRAELEDDASTDALSSPAAAGRSEVEQEARAAVRSHLSDPDFGAKDLANAVGASRSTLYRRLQKKAGLSPSALIADVRMQQARRLLERGEPVTQVAYAVGYERLSSFSRAFQRHTGQSPSSVASD